MSENSLPPREQDTRFDFPNQQEGLISIRKQSVFNLQEIALWQNAANDEEDNKNEA